MKPKDGGPAFPFQEKTTELDCSVPYERVVNTYYGLSVRDYFAGQALVGIAHAERMMGAFRYDDDYPDLARLAYGIADAMLKAREEEV